MAGLFNWAPPAGPIGLKGLLAQQFDPTKARYAAGSEALLQAGLGILNRDPYAPPTGIAGLLGRGFAGAAAGADKGAEDFYSNGMRNVQLSQMQKEQDTQDERSKALATFKASPEYAALPSTAKSYIDIYPEQGLKAWMDAQATTTQHDVITTDAGVFDYTKGKGPAGMVKLGERPTRNEGEGRDFQQENKLRQSYLDEVKPFAQARQMYQRMRASYDGTKTDQTGASDIAMVFSYMKMLDPTSVVREGEQATAQSAGGVPSQIVVMYNKLLTGERLSPQVRDSFMAQSTKQYQQQEQSYAQTRKTYQTLAQQYQLDPERTAPDISYGVQSKSQPDSSSASPPPGIDPNIWQHMTPEERALWQR